MSIKNSIGWCDMTLNPINGLCYGDCVTPDGRQYCYYSGERGIAKRFGISPELSLDLTVFDKLPKKKPKRVFLCSTNDMWSQRIPDEWILKIMANIEANPQHLFFILTKESDRILRFENEYNLKWPNNCWVGTTITRIKEYFRWYYLRKVTLNIPVKFVSFEPLFEDVGSNFFSTFFFMTVPLPKWIILGRLTGFGYKYDPPREWLEKILKEASHFKIPVFCKDNIRSILGENLRQEVPK